MQRRSPASCKRSTTCARRSARPSKVSAPLRKLTCPIGRFPVSDFDSSFEAGQLAALFKPKLTSEPNRRGADLLLRSLSSRRAGQGGSARARLARIFRRPPAVMVKVTGGAKGMHHAGAHFDYIGPKSDVPRIGRTTCRQLGGCCVADSRGAAYQ